MSTGTSILPFIKDSDFRRNPFCYCIVFSLFLLFLLRIPTSVGILSVIVLSFLYSYYSYYYYSYPQTNPETLQQSTASYDKMESIM